LNYNYNYSFSSLDSTVVLTKLKDLARIKPESRFSLMLIITHHGKRIPEKAVDFFCDF